MFKITIVIPVYGVEKYIERCARSLFEQSLDDIEYIFVDDCTPDNSIKILKDVIEKYPKRKKSTKIIEHEINKGLPGARHTGYLHATGEYVLHCDSDDWLLPETCKELYNKAIEDISDVVVFDLQRTDGIFIKAANTTDIEKFTLDMMYMRSSWSVVNKMFKRSVYDVVRQFPTRNVGEDMALCLQLIYGCKRMSYINKAFYQYYINPESMSNSITIDKTLRRYEDGKHNADIILDFYYHKPISNTILSALVYIKWSARKIIYGITYKTEYFLIWRNTYKGIERDFCMNPQVRISEKVKMILTYFRICPLNKERIYK